MNLNIFSPVKRARKRAKDKDEFDKVIDLIEEFAPKEYLSQREAFYYNYRIMTRYRRPLLGLLEAVSQVSMLKQDRPTHTRELFVRLKGFYDIRDRLTIGEALEDTALMRKFQEFFTIFYGGKEFMGEDIREWLGSLF